MALQDVHGFLGEPTVHIDDLRTVECMGMQFGKLGHQVRGCGRLKPTSELRHFDDIPTTFIVFAQRRHAFRKQVPLVCRRIYAIRRYCDAAQYARHTLPAVDIRSRTLPTATGEFHGSGMLRSERCNDFPLCLVQVRVSDLAPVAQHSSQQALGVSQDVRMRRMRRERTNAGTSGLYQPIVY